MTTTSERVDRLEVVAAEDGNRRVIRVSGRPPAPVKRRGTVAWYVPYTKVEATTVANAPMDAVWIDVAASDSAYYAALLDIWGSRETFALLEHDVICRPDVIRAFEECPEPWCSYGYSNICCQDENGYSPCQEAWANQLGCVRFRKELIEAAPRALSSIPPEHWDWRNVCDRIGERLRAAGHSHHWHRPGVDHRGAGWI